MTLEEILLMARDSGCEITAHNSGWVNIAFCGVSIERFANLIASAEREACANMCEVFAAGMENGLHQGMSDIEARLTNEFAKIGRDLAETIRMRGNK